MDINSITQNQWKDFLKTFVGELLIEKNLYGYLRDNSLLMYQNMNNDFSEIPFSIFGEEYDLPVYDTTDLLSRLGISFSDFLNLQMWSLKNQDKLQEKILDRMKSVIDKLPQHYSLTQELKQGYDIFSKVKGVPITSFGYFDALLQKIMRKKFPLLMDTLDTMMKLQTLVQTYSLISFSLVIKEYIVNFLHEQNIDNEEKIVYLVTLYLGKTGPAEWNMSGMFLSKVGWFLSTSTIFDPKCSETLPDIILPNSIVCEVAGSTKGFCRKYYRVEHTSIPEWLALEPEKLTIKDILEEVNEEIRRIMVDIYGWEKFVQESNAEIIDHEEPYGTLYRIETNGEPILFVKVINRTAEPDGSFKIYYLPVHHELRTLPDLEEGLAGELGDEPQELTVRNAIASTFGKLGHEYHPEIET